MSGIITGPYFKKYFNDPGAGELGIMVSVLEIGALSTPFEKITGTLQPPHSALMLHSNFACCRARRRRDRSQGHPLQWCSGFYHWRSNPNLHRGDPQHGCREVYLRIWCWIVVVSIPCLNCNMKLHICPGRSCRYTRARFLRPAM
jgi:hypothetical protein